MLNFLRATRWLNTFFVLLAQSIVMFYLLGKPFSIETLLVLVSTFFILTAGYIENNRYDYELDTVCKGREPNEFLYSQNSLTWAFTFYTLGMVAALILSLQSGIFNIVYLNMACIVLLHFYNLNLKKIPLVGNLVVALLCVLAIVYPYLLYKNLYLTPIYIVISLFILTWIREWVKDMEDRECDSKFGYRTLAIILPEFGSVVALSIIIFIYIVYLFYLRLNFHYFLMVLPIISLILINFRKWSLASDMLKWSILFGILTLFYL